MGTTTKLQVALTKELTDLVRRAVKSGEYDSDSEVVSEALREWKLRRLTNSEKVELRRLWREGVESGPGRLRSFGAIKREARRRLAAG
jgi:antitoxin ParD1/3/4